mmetsp:Transcript_84480/g.234233  ORF Transcript_84480/g.234233 Transcript_84480/m.234233 type:complete len:304 (+) Transcript_84480:45-956(+)
MEHTLHAKRQGRGRSHSLCVCIARLALVTPTDDLPLLRPVVVVLLLCLPQDGLLRLLVALHAEAVVALPALENSLALRDVGPADVALVGGVRLPPLERVALRAGRRWQLRRRPEEVAGHGPQHLADDLLLHAVHAAAPGPPPAAALLLAALPPWAEDGLAHGLDELVQHRLLDRVQLLGETAEEGCKEVRGGVLLHLLRIYDAGRVVAAAPLRVREHLVGRRNLLELGGGVRVVWVLVGMPAQGEAAVGPPDVALVRIRGHAERRVDALGVRRLGPAPPGGRHGRRRGRGEARAPPRPGTWRA